MKILWAKLAVVAAVAMFFPLLAHSQNCALCYTQAAGAGQRVIQALKSGILVLIFPPMSICIGLTWMGWKKRDRFHVKPESSSDDLGW